MYLNLDLNEVESKEFHEYMEWLQNYKNIDHFDDVEIFVKEKLAELIYKVYRKKGL